jgi:uncharacterized delta-60 repeat protein
MDGGVMALFRLTENGGWDTAGFNAGAVRPQLPGRYVYVAAPGTAYGVALQGTDPQQRIIVAGRQGVSRSDQTYDYDGAVWGFTAAGVPDSTFETSGMVTTGFAHVDDDFRAVVVDTSDRIVATGSKYISSNYADGTEAMLVRYAVNGAPDFEFNDGDPITIRRPEMSSHSPNAIAIDSQGNILVGESASKRDAGGAYLGSMAGLWRFTSGGALDPTWGGGWIADALLTDGQYASWRGLTLQTNGKVVAAGSSSWGAYYPVLIRYWQ